jgi:hypothetical protein
MIWLGWFAPLEREEKCLFACLGDLGEVWKTKKVWLSILAGHKKGWLWICLIPATSGCSITGSTAMHFIGSLFGIFFALHLGLKVTG